MSTDTTPPLRALCVCVRASKCNNSFHHLEKKQVHISKLCVWESLIRLVLPFTSQQQQRERELRKQHEREQRRRYEEMEQLRREEERRHAEREQVHALTVVLSQTIWLYADRRDEKFSFRLFFPCILFLSTSTCSPVFLTHSWLASFSHWPLVFFFGLMDDVFAVQHHVAPQCNW